MAMIRLPCLLWFLLLPCLPMVSLAGELNLPELGDRTSGIITPQQERELGDAWLRLYRNRVPEYTDAELSDYLQQLLTRLAAHSDLKDKSLQLIVINNNQINAFAAPGGIIGANTGLLLYSQSEAELAGVFAHELAHLSQRHWVRGLENSRENLLPVMAGLLTGLVLLATNNGPAGMAAITSTQAASAESSLRFNRQHEQEADNIGIKTLADSGYDPRAMTNMFERMLDATRYLGQRPPEFLLSHPVTERRISDSKLRTLDVPPADYHEDSLIFHLMRARLQLHHAETPQVAIKRFQSELEGKSLNAIASRYGLAIAQTKARQFDEAEKNLRWLMEHQAGENRDVERAYTLALARLELERNQPGKALALLDARLQQHPMDYPTRLLQAEIFYQDKQYAQAEKVLRRLSLERPTDVEVWHQLAEVSGLSGNILGVHLARSEWFILNGVYDKARLQLNYALKMVEGNYIETERTRQRIRDIEQLEKISLKI